MAGDVINLNKARKARVAAAAERQAALNRVRHGATKAGKQQAEAELDAANRKLDGLRIAARDGEDDSGPSAA